MTATLRPTARFPLAPGLQPLARQADPAAPQPDLPLYSLEVIAPSGQAPQLDGWTVQGWPVASLGDLTLQARPQHPATPDDLRAALLAAGFTPLGPVRTHR
ncbi:hypothetical protein CBQ26_17695 [Deinococcus indicus]|uniref:Uncharacterized protein n=1 Tax=Deinococcus indicus TaxID=223556 RepID=A0A246BFB4_9DEIO|nr:hypothetical protein [Deinococcus indicus]OWL93907.1 hypothetical protein CBQ26_17695 [Deinococcus indicus]GHG15814.1 hypothetical protein GCM10017784_03090 [Deinococcus indicus]